LRKIEGEVGIEMRDKREKGAEVEIEGTGKEAKIEKRIGPKVVIEKKVMIEREGDVYSIFLTYLCLL
jgi:hypothetical protein